MEPPFYPDDIVIKKSEAQELAVIERTHDDVDTHSPYPGRSELEPILHEQSISGGVFRRFMKDGIPPKGTVLVRWQADPSLELIPTSKLNLLDRSLLIGDVVKRSVSDAMSGVVVNTRTRCTLQPMSDISCQGPRTLKGILPPGDWSSHNLQVYSDPNSRVEPLVDIPASELQYAESPTEDDLVIYKDWIGRVERVMNHITVRLADNCVTEIDDDLGEHVDGTTGGFCIGDIVKTKKGDLRMGRWIYGKYNPNTKPIATVVFVRTSGVKIDWLQRCIGSPNGLDPPAVLEADELASADFHVYDRTRRPAPPSSGVGAHSQTVSNAEIDLRLNLRVRFRDFGGACLKYSDTDGRSRIPRLDRRDHLGYDLNVFDVISFHTDVTVQWDDLSITTEDSITLIPDASIDDEHAAWPSEIVHSLDMQPENESSVIESPRRVGVVQAVSAVDRMATIRWCPNSYIKYCKDPDDEGAAPSVLSYRIDSTMSTEEQTSLYDVEAPAALNIRRGDIVLIGPSEFGTYHYKPGDIDWLGEIVDTLLDGRLIVRLGAAMNVRDVELSREQCVVAVRSDGTDYLDGWGDEEDAAFGDSEEDFESDSEFDNMDWEREGSLDVKYEDEDGNPLAEEDVEDEAWESEDDEDAGDATMEDRPGHTVESSAPLVEKPLQANAETFGAGVRQLNPQMSGPESYAILGGEVPTNHYFQSQPITTAPIHTKRTHKEHKILRNPSSLPEGVFIRTWESRLDLLRVLFIGPTETPYENAPFVVDFYLPSAFPAEPPRAFFHSWPAHVSIGAIGRVNPNLYEDGKICLSILGTWDGNKSEGWSAARSTLLQVIVSLLGLVLVREPYFNEAGYEPLVGSEASRRPSALYSERIFLRAKGFLITALSTLSSNTAVPKATGLEGLEDVLRWLYVTPEGPKLLTAMTRNVEEVLRRSEEGGESNGLTVMSKGACVPLKRVLDRLRELQQ